ncbi:Ff.00g003580.m01.CDS01 [Fusarium sp. VM40]|nr:Ff.00g003580.m01.CDS01 [Fusarium sp. VM40]
MFGSKSFQGGVAKMLTSLTCLLAASQICVAAPHTSQLSTRDVHQLYSRRPTAEIQDFEDKIKACDPYVPQGEAQFLDFTPEGNHLIGSQGFQGCFGIVIATKQGAIVGHYSQDPQDLAKAKTEIRDLYNKHNAQVGGAPSYLYSAVEYPSGEVTQQDIYDQYVTFLNDLTGKDPVHHSYTEAANLLTDEQIDNEDYAEEFLAGGIVVSNSGGGSAETDILFVTIDMLRDSTFA